MESLDTECTPLKTKYDECFNKWFRDRYLKGESDHEKVCGELFKAYQKCLKAALEKQNISSPELYTNILGTEKEKKSN